jgi:hypothetical protein
MIATIVPLPVTYIGSKEGGTNLKGKSANLGQVLHPAGDVQWTIGNKPNVDLRVFWDMKP